MIKIYVIPANKIAKVKAVLEAPEVPTKELDVQLEQEAGKGKAEAAKEWKVNEFERQGYLLREASALGIKSSNFYLYIKADEAFFERNEKVLLDSGAEVLKGKEFQEVKTKIETQEEEAAEAVGAVFG